jgi:hypothetical protein
MKDNQNEQLFSELTPAEAAVVEGGLRVVIDHIEAIEAAADFLGPDDTYIQINGKKVWGDHTMSKGELRQVNRSATGPGSSLRVELFDADWDFDDKLGAFNAVNTKGVQKRVRVSGSGSIYDVFYRGYA